MVKHKVESIGNDIFGNPVFPKFELKDKFIVPPFSVLDTKTGEWQNRKRIWKEMGIKSELGRDSSCIHMDTTSKEKNKTNYVSIFDPVLCEIMYNWFCPEKGKILDPFAGGSVRGIVAAYNNYFYTGIDLRQEQVLNNEIQANEILEEKKPCWVIGDSEKELDKINGEFDMMFTCPPYGDLEVYSNDKDDLSNMSFERFVEKYKAIIKKSCKRLKKGAYACIVVGDYRDKNGNYRCFPEITSKAFVESGMVKYNELILLNSIASASMRANKQFTASQKAVKIHQNVLVFKK
jgi:DNA modification methylase